jgi:hypothetical protein
MVFMASARWNFRGETWLSVEIDADNVEIAGAMFYSMLPATFFRGTGRMVSIRPQDHAPSFPALLASGRANSTSNDRLLEGTGTD